MELGQEVAAERLKAALAQQELLTEACTAAEGTAGERMTQLRLQATKLQVAVCTRLANSHGRPEDTRASS